MTIQEFKIGKEYTFTELIKVRDDNSDFRLTTPGANLIGATFAVLHANDNKCSCVSFVLVGIVSNGNEYIYRCIYSDYTDCDWEILWNPEM